MYAYLRGKVIHMGTDSLILDVNGVGYQVFANQVNLPDVHARADSETALYIYTHFSAQQGAMALFGFSTLAEKDMFERLIQISGVGPKAAMSILSRLKPDELAAAVFSENLTAFKGIPGVGQKTVQRIILELRGKITMNEYGVDPKIVPAKRKNVDEAIQALIGLGYSSKEATKAVTSLENIDEPVDKLIKLALMNMKV